MRKIRKAGKVATWILGILMALLLATYATLFVANLEDKPPVAEIAALLSLLNDASPVDSDNNSYFLVLGFAGPPDSDPMSLGIERHKWMQGARPDFDRSNDPLREDHDFRAQRSSTVTEIAKTCAASEAECARALGENEEAVEEWLVEERWLLDRYRSLISMTEFSEATPFESLAPLPPFGNLMEAQRLHMVDAWKAATEGQALSVSYALNRDLTYWRMVLKNSDTLITKMIATAAIIRHFKVGNVVLRRLPHEMAADGIPASWQAQISDAERSMQRSLAGEWAYFDAATKRMAANSEEPFGTWISSTDHETLDRVAWVLLRPFWQPQDLSNRHARMMFDLGNALDVPYEEIPRAVELADDLQEPAHRPFTRLYNFTGDIMMSVSFWKFSNYAVRVSDLEGIRRAALSAARLRAESVAKEDVAQRLLASEIVDPYTNEPLTWHDGENAIVFYGLEPNDRSRHELLY